MGDTAGELSDRVQLLDLTDPLLQRLALGNVLGRAVQANRLAGGIELDLPLCLVGIQTRPGSFARVSALSPTCGLAVL